MNHRSRPAADGVRRWGWMLCGCAMAAAAVGATFALAQPTRYDGVVTVVDPGTLDASAIEDLRDALDGLPTNPLGLVLVQPMPRGIRTRRAPSHRQWPTSTRDSLSLA